MFAPALIFDSEMLKMQSERRMERDIEGIDSECKSLSVSRIEVHAEEVVVMAVMGEAVVISVTAHVEVDTQGGVAEDPPSSIQITVV